MPFNMPRDPDGTLAAQPPIVLFPSVGPSESDGASGPRSMSTNFDCESATDCDCACACDIAHAQPQRPWQTRTFAPSIMI